MHKGDLVKEIAEKTKTSQKDCEAQLNATLEIITKSLKKGEDVTLIGFGTFKKHRSEARTGRNPQTGKELKIKASNKAKFSAGKALKEALN